MSFDSEKLRELLPAIYRIRDAEQGGPLGDLLSVIAEQVAVLEENLDQLYDDQFIETCADWVTPYIGTLIGYRSLHGVAPRISSPRAEVANTIALRRRKGTASMLEQLARDVTGWPARVVELFQRLATTQYMNHIRPGHAFTPDLRAWEPLERLDTAFDSLAHTVDVRSISRGGGRYNIPNIGVFLWRLKPYRLQDSPAVGLDGRRFFFSPLGNDIPLFTRHESEERISHLAEPINVPAPISRRVLNEYLEDYYGEDKSLVIKVDGTIRTASEVQVCNLENAGGAWAHAPTDKIAIDPMLGRIAFPEDIPAGSQVLVTFHYGFSDDTGGGMYERGHVPSTVRVPDDFATIQEALDSLGAAGGVVELTDSRRYEESLSLHVQANTSVRLRASNERRPTLVLSSEFVLTGDEGAAVTLDGLLVSGAGVRVPDLDDNALERLDIQHCTLVPGATLDEKSVPQQPLTASLRVDIANVTIAIKRSIVGPLRVADGSRLQLTDSIVDATEPSLVAFSGPFDTPGDEPPGGELSTLDTTVIGKIYTERFELVSNSILHAALGESDGSQAPVHANRKQEGCLRFSYVPRGSIVPRQFRCQPQLATDSEVGRQESKLGTRLNDAEREKIAKRLASRILPTFTALRYGFPGYGQLSTSVPRAIRRGAEDEAEMGAFHKLYQPQRETNLTVRLEEYLRFGLEAGVFYET